jgi:hypothetical protein
VTETWLRYKEKKETASDGGPCFSEQQISHSDIQQRKIKKEGRMVITLFFLNIHLLGRVG